MARPGEFELIERYFAPLSGEGSFGLKDDAALIDVPDGMELAVTQDAIAAGIHFLASDPPDAIARKALRVNLSDLAAKGATPTQFSLALGLPSDWDEQWLAAFSAGLAADCGKYGLSLSGGDTFRVEKGPVIAITAWGTTKKSNYTGRMGACAGDDLYLTGRIGESALGLLVHCGKLAVDRGEWDQRLAARYLVPEPPVEFAPAIAAHASSAIDISDGLIGDLNKLAEASGVDFRIALADIPLTKALEVAGSDRDLTLIALTGGDDYQIAFTAAPGKRDELQGLAKRASVEIRRLCRARSGKGKVTLMDAEGEELPIVKPSYSHF